MGHNEALESLRTSRPGFMMMQRWFELLRVKLLQRFGTGTVEILGNTYVTSRHVLSPKYFDTSEFLAAHLQIRDGDDVLDMGTGCGIQALSAARAARRVVAIDINSEAVRCARGNALRNRLGDKVTVLHGDLFAPLPPGTSFDVIIFNPPYWEGRPRDEFEHALFDPGQSCIRRFLAEAHRHLRPGGSLQILYSSSGGPPRFAAIAQEMGWNASVIASYRVSVEEMTIHRLTRPQIRDAPHPSASSTS